MILTLNEVKAHLNISTSFTLDDSYLTDLIAAVENIIETDIRESLDDVAGDYAIPKGLVHAAKMLVAHFYENRETVVVGVSVNKLPLAYEHLIEPYKNWTIG
jgi:uncharacterized phage protein (predicted DNA packaging)